MSVRAAAGPAAAHKGKNVNQRGIYPAGFSFHALLSYPNTLPLSHVEHPPQEIEIITNGLLLANIAADAPDGRPGKRKASNTIRAHWGLPSDSSDRLSLIAQKIK